MVISLSRRCVLALLASLLMASAGQAQDSRITSSSPAPGDSSVALESTVTFTFNAPLDTTHRLEDTGTDWPVAFAALSPRDSLQIDSVRYSADLTQIRFDVTHTDNTDFVWIVSEAIVTDTTNGRSYLWERLMPPYVLRYTTANRAGRYNVSGEINLCIPTKRLADPAWFMVALLRSVPVPDRPGDSFRTIAASEADVAAAAIVDEGEWCWGDYTVTGVRPGTYWPIAVEGHFVDRDGFSGVLLDNLSDGSPDSIIVADSSLNGINIDVRWSATEGSIAPDAATLHPNQPNPVRASTRLPFTLEHAAQVRLVVYDLVGRRVATLVDGFYGPGEHAARWDAKGQPAGVYVVWLEGEGFSASRPIVVLH